jgi:coenzyme F420-reducing hydrogenase delta subunit
MQYPVNVRIVHTPCTGKIEMEHVLDAFEKGIDGILVAGCLEGGCHFLEGNLRARKHTGRIREILDEIGIGAERLKMVNLSAAMAPTFVERVEEIVETVRALGPSPLKPSSRKESAGES